MQWRVHVWFQIVTSKPECGLESYKVAKEEKELETVHGSAGVGGMLSGVRVRKRQAPYKVQLSSSLSW